MIHKLKIFAAMAAAAVSATACLEKYPDDAVLSDRAMNTLEHADQTIIGIYAKFKNPALYSGYLTLCPDLQADLVYAVDGYSNTYGDIWRWDILATNPEIEAVYAGLYSVIASCNFFFDNVEKVRNTLTEESEFEKLQRFEGEAYFARALAYSELIKMFCKAYDPKTAKDELGVVLTTKYYNPETPVRANLEKSYEFVLTNLEKAYEYLEKGDYMDGNYFTKDAACALYARVYLYMQDWDNAIKYSTEVIGNTGFTLSSVSTAATSTQSEYKYLWTNDFGREVIWRVGFTSTSRGGALGGIFLNGAVMFDYRTYRPDYVPATRALNLYASADRRYGTFFKSIQTGHTHGLTWPVLVKYEGNESFFSENIYYTNMPKVFRLSEQYLIRAEAYCNKKDFTNAAKDITSLRIARYTNYGSTSLTEANWLQTIDDERVRELYMEGFRLNDLKRWKKGFERTPQQSSVKSGSSLRIEAGDPLFVWPIPQNELDSPGAQIEPNESNK